MEIKRQSFRKLFRFALIILSIWLIFIRPEYNASNLRKKGQETTGIIYRKSGVGSKGTIRCFYTFSVNGQAYEGFYDNDKLNQGDSLDIVYYPDNPKLNQAKQFLDDY